MDEPSDHELVERVLAIFESLSGPEVQRYFPGDLTANDVHRWRRGDFKFLLPVKRRFLLQLLATWDDEGRPGARRLAELMGKTSSDRVEFLKHFLNHLAQDMSLSDRERLGERILQQDDYSPAERQEVRRYFATCRQVEASLDDKHRAPRTRTG
jgi:hypothetical protein